MYLYTVYPYTESIDHFVIVILTSAFRKLVLDTLHRVATDIDSYQAIMSHLWVAR
jgi:hypothetical protein